MLHHVFMVFRVRNINFCACDACMMSTQCGAFRVHNVNFHANDVRMMHASTTDRLPTEIMHNG